MEIRRIFIMCTYNCNLHCSYCYEPTKFKRNINVDKLKLALKDEFKLKFDGFILTFHGGEPFLAFDAIKNICEWVWSEYPDKNIKCAVTTNGTVLSDSIKSWLSNNLTRFHVGLSIDGKPETHNRHRDNSFHNIDFDFFRTLHKPSAKMTVHPESVNQMFENFLYVQQMGFDVSISPAMETEWSQEALSHYGIQLKLLADYQLSHTDNDLLSIFHYRLEKFSEIHPGSRWNCGTGYYEVAYDINGCQRLCHAFISDFKSKWRNMDKIVSVIRNSSASVELTECKGCTLLRACSPCIGLNYMNRGSISSVYPSFCLLTKIGMRITAYLYANALIHANQYVWLRDLDSTKKAMICQGIKHVLKI